MYGETMIRALERYGYRAEPENTGGGCMVLHVWLNKQKGVYAWLDDTFNEYPQMGLYQYGGDSVLVNDPMGEDGAPLVQLGPKGYSFNDPRQSATMAEAFDRMVRAFRVADPVEPAKVTVLFSGTTATQSYQIRGVTVFGRTTYVLSWHDGVAGGINETQETYDTENEALLRLAYLSALDVKGELGKDPGFDDTEWAIIKTWAGVRG
jgi:hypothetical protein